jgi:hypothetical protein
MASILVYSFDFKSFQSVGLHEFLIYGCLSYQNVEALLTPYLIVFVFFFFSPLSGMAELSYLEKIILMLYLNLTR